MTTTTAFDSLQSRLRRTAALPPIPQTAALLLQALDGGEASARDLERIISADPVLAADVLSVASTRSEAVNEEATLRHAIMVLGQRAIRSLALSMIVRSVAFKGAQAPSFDPEALSRHSLAIAFIARHLFSRALFLNRFVTNLAPDEVFAAGVLHEVGTALLARLEPGDYERTFLFAKRTSKSFDAAFSQIYGVPVSELSCIAADMWALPNHLRIVIEQFSEPSKGSEEYVAACCVNFAHEVARRCGLHGVPWDSEPWYSTEAGEFFAGQEEEIELLLSRVTSQVDAMSQRQPRAA